MHCADCAARIEREIGKLNGIRDVHAILKSQRVHVELDVQPPASGEILKILSDMGFVGTVELLDDTIGIRDHGEKGNFYTLIKQQLFKIRLVASLILVVALGLLEIAEHYFGFNFPKAQFILTLPFFWICLPLFKNVIHGPAKANLVHYAVALGLFAYSVMNTFFREGATPYYLPALVIAMSIVSLSIQRRLSRKSRVYEKQLRDYKPRKVKIVQGEMSGKYIALRDAKPGDHIEVKPHDRISVDGTIIHGHSTVDESFLMGESIPKEKGAGDTVVAGSLNQSGTIIIRAEVVGKNTILSRMIRSVTEARKTESHKQVMINRVSWAVMPIAVLVASGTFFGWYFASVELHESILLSASVLLIASPFAFRVVTPLAYQMSLQKLATRGVLVGQVTNLELVEQIDSIIFGFSGVLTPGQPRVTDILGGNRFKIIQMAGSLASLSEHPYARAIARKAAERGVNISPNVKEVHEYYGRGIEGNVDGRTLVIGSPEYVEERGVDLTNSLRSIVKLEKKGKAVEVLATKKEVLGILGVKDEMRTEADPVLKYFQSWKGKVLVATGHHTISMVRKFSRYPKVESVFAPGESKRKVVAKHQEGKSRVMAISGRDSQNINSADVRVIMNRPEYEQFSHDTILLLVADLARVVDLFRIAANTSKIIGQNLFFVFIYNAAAVGLTLTGAIHPALAIVISAMSPIIVLFNSLRLKNDPKK
ncbi:heavy metal translocating P-type ATPase [Patescibacteria group bacterium]